MNSIAKQDVFDGMPHTPATDVKRLGWRGVMRTLSRQGKLVVTHHSEPEAVILSTAEYGALIGALRSANARDEDVLDTLRRRFDKRLASLNTPGATKSLRATMTRRVKLGGKVRAGASH